ncbi:unnamed protein product [Heligmosomoides polygyrus]|uniref:Alpha-1,3-glucosyltransferase n=1 Tax=Heligmosomoides polygyrus TaxID=6339 RepID=A0A3P7WK83_HELPZ|nr:unnamed protein product [Heligmosomoides polygyrus]
MLALKVLLIPSYTSTDFEVHRNWMAITHNLPLSQWYYESTSEWTLDYPPFFAYFEKCLATIAYYCGLEDILSLQKDALFNNRVLYFQRLSVIGADVLYVSQVSNFCGFRVIFGANRSCSRIATFTALSCHFGLILVDNIHFQYNSLLTALLILSIYFADRENYLLSALFYCVLLNFKHIYLYYAPAYVVFMLRRYFFKTADDLLEFSRTLISGLTHAYWAPNFWAIYNVVDLALYRILSLWKPHLFEAPTYSSGLVQVYEHSVLPTITAPLSLLCVLASLVPLFATVFKKRVPDLCTLLSLSAFSFFWFGYHVHEKALLLMAIPLLCQAFTDPKFIRLAVMFSVITATSLFPLLFTVFEIQIKYCIALTYILLLLLLIRYTLVEIIPRQLLILFGAKLAFLPLMLISVYNAVGVLICYLWLIVLVFDDDIGVAYKKKHCELVEGLIKSGFYPVQAVESLEEVEIVGGIDISTSKTNNDFAVVAFSVFEYPNMKVRSVWTLFLDHCWPYITDYLAVREAAPVSEFINRVLADQPQLRPDVLLCDGNGQFHARGCGLACHIGALTGIATVGVAKNLNLSILKSCIAVDSGLFPVLQLVARVSSQTTDGYAPYDVILPVVMNITRLGGSKVPVYVSAGYGIELDLGTNLVMSTARNRICEPIRSADLHSREKVREYFDG